MAYSHARNFWYPNQPEARKLGCRSGIVVLPTNGVLIMLRRILVIPIVLALNGCVGPLVHEHSVQSVGIEPIMKAREMPVISEEEAEGMTDRIPVIRAMRGVGFPSY